MIENRWQSFDNRLVLRYFAVEHTEGVCFCPPLAVGAHPRRDITQFLAQQLDECRPAIGTSHGVDEQLEAVETGCAKNLDDHLDDFRVDSGRFRTDRFGADLVKLPVAAL